MDAARGTCKREPRGDRRDGTAVCTRTGRRLGPEGAHGTEDPGVGWRRVVNARLAGGNDKCFMGEDSG